MTKGLKTDYPILAFRSQSDWRSWLVKNHAGVEGIWLRIYKKDSGVETVTYAEALDEALCFGWIDGQRKAYNAKKIEGNDKKASDVRKNYMTGSFFSTFLCPALP